MLVTDYRRLEQASVTQIARALRVLEAQMTQRLPLARANVLEARKRLLLEAQAKRLRPRRLENAASREAHSKEQ